MNKYIPGDIPTNKKSLYTVKYLFLKNSYKKKHSPIYNHSIPVDLVIIFFKTS